MLLQTRCLCKTFTRDRFTVNAVDCIDFHVAEGDFITITGNSGSGKTTLLTLLAGLLSPDSGAMIFNGQDLHALPDAARSGLRGREIGFVPQGASLLGNFTAVDNIRMSQAFMRDGAASSERTGFLLEAVGLTPLADAYPAHMSGGEMRRVAIARALFNSPRLVLADEPTSDLDPENSHGVMDLLERINALGTAVVVVTHEEAAAARGRRRLHMRAGRLEEETN